MHRVSPDSYHLSSQSIHLVCCIFFIPATQSEECADLSDPAVVSIFYLVTHRNTLEREARLIHASSIPAHQLLSSSLFCRLLVLPNYRLGNTCVPLPAQCGFLTFAFHTPKYLYRKLEPCHRPLADTLCRSKTHHIKTSHHSSIKKEIFAHAFNIGAAYAAVASPFSILIHNGPFMFWK